MIEADAQAEWLLWQLADSSFPTGGYAHSGGLEAAWQQGEVRNGQELHGFVEASLHQLGQGSLPFVTAAHSHPETLLTLDQLCQACTTNHVANRASRLLGRAFLSGVERVFGKLDPDAGPLPFGHFAPVFGAATASMQLPAPKVSHLFFFLHLRSLLAAAVRLSIVGPIEAQKLQARLATCAQEISKSCQALTVDDLAQTAPLLDVWQGAQDRLYSRLFQS